MTELVLAIGHHVLVFSLAGVLAAELALLRPGISGRQLWRVARLDMAYGILAALILGTGFARVFFGGTGAAFYLHNPVFWAKIGAFALVGILSIPPTVRLFVWRRELEKTSAFVPDAGAISSLRRYMYLEAAVFLLIPMFAALMARGVGL